ALWKIERRTKDIIPTLDALLASKGSGDQEAAIDAIGEIGPVLRDSHGTQLLGLMHSNDPFIRTKVYRMLPVFARDKEVAAQELSKAILVALPRCVQVEAD